MLTLPLLLRCYLRKAHTLSASIFYSCTSALLTASLIPDTGAFSTPRNSATLARCPTIDLSSDTIYLQIADLTGEGLSPTKVPQIVGSPGYLQLSLATNWRFP